MPVGCSNMATSNTFYCYWFIGHPTCSVLIAPCHKKRSSSFRNSFTSVSMIDSNNLTFSMLLMIYLVVHEDHLLRTNSAFDNMCTNCPLLCRLKFTVHEFYQRIIHVICHKTGKQKRTFCLSGETQHCRIKWMGRTNPKGAHTRHQPACLNKWLRIARTRVSPVRLPWVSRAFRVIWRRRLWRWLSCRL
jgi:hypothetical protein